MKRKLSLRATPSPFSAKVTLYEATDTVESASVRTSKRLKVAAARSSEQPYDAEDHVSPKATKLPIPDVKAEVGASTSSEVAAARPKPHRVSSPRKPKPIPTALEVPHPAPPRWRETYGTIKRMRSHIVAPVDTMGCDRAQLKEADPRVRDSASRRRSSSNTSSRISVSRRLSRLCCPPRRRMRLRTLLWLGYERLWGEVCP